MGGGLEFDLTHGAVELATTGCPPVLQVAGVRHVPRMPPASVRHPRAALAARPARRLPQPPRQGRHHPLLRLRRPPPQLRRLQAKEAGSTHFCMEAAWRETIGRKTNFSQILKYVKKIRAMGMEVCGTLSMIEKQQAEKLKKAGLTAYNHNLDTSREYYANIITTRSYDDILQTLKHAHEAGISILSGLIQKLSITHLQHNKSVFEYHTDTNEATGYLAQGLCTTAESSNVCLPGDSEDGLYLSACSS